MNTPEECLSFRARLELALSGVIGEGPLVWHEHLFACAECRELFAGEQALDELLASLPQPELPPRVRERLRERLRAEVRLDELLGCEENTEVPDGLAQRVLESLEPARAEARLDDLLDRVPAPRAPSDLAARVLRGLESERAGESIVPTARLVRPAHMRGVLLAMAAGLLMLFGLFAWRARDRGEPLAVEPEEELLASLEVLEHWDLLMGDDVDFWLAELALEDAEVALGSEGDEPDEER